MKKLLISGISVIAIGIVAFISVPKESKADLQTTIPDCPCGINGGTREVFKVRRYGAPTFDIVRTSLDCMTSAEITALPPLTSGPGYTESYELGCGSIIGGPLD